MFRLLFRPGYNQICLDLSSWRHIDYGRIAQLTRHFSITNSKLKEIEVTKDKPIKYTTSQAHIDYRAARNFYTNDQHLPPSHNVILAGTGVFAFFYLIFLRDEVDEDGGLSLFRPVHETVPELAIPLLKQAIAQNRKYGNNTTKLEKKLASLMENSEKYGGDKQKLIEN